MAKLNDWEISTTGGKTFISEDGKSIVAWCGKPSEIAFAKVEAKSIIIQMGQYVVRIDETTRSIEINLG